MIGRDDRVKRPYKTAASKAAMRFQRWLSAVRLAPRPAHAERGPILRFRDFCILYVDTAHSLMYSSPHDANELYLHHLRFPRA